MRMSEQVVLRTEKISADAGGFPKIEATERAVFAEVKSVSRAEFYRADANGRKVDIVFLVHADDFQRAESVEYNGQIYNIIREYRPNVRTVELTCSRR